MMTVRFSKGHAPYKVGDIAGFPEGEAKKLIEAGVCEAYGTKKAAQPKQEPKEETEEPGTKQVDQAPHNKQVQEAPKKK